jgi:predicted Zn-dependent protease
MMKPFALFPVVAFFMLSLSACSVNPATGQQSFTGLMSSEKELEVGKDEHPKILQQFGGAYEHSTLESYINDLGQRLAKTSELPDIKWTFTILDDPIINAFALPGGYVYISRGLIALAENEAELAAVLGHEIGHVTARHTAQRYSKSVLTGIGSTILGIVIGGPAGDIANYAGQAYLAGYSRDHEMEADMLGMRYMTKLGYDPKASATFFEKLAAHTELEARMKGQKVEEGHYAIFASHPDTKSRIVASQKIAKSYPQNLTKTARTPFLEQVDGLTYGQNPKQGIIDGQTFIHPDLRMQFTAPDGFVYTNAPSYVAATDKNGSGIVFQMGKNDSRLPITQYLTKTWAAKYSLQNVQTLSIDNKQAATGMVRLKTSKGIRDIRYLAIEDGSDVFLFRFLTPPELTNQMEVPLRKTTYSFHRLSDQEAKKVKGDHIALYRVGSNDTMAGLANKMAIGKLNEDWLNVLNKEQLSDGLQRGETIKLVVK